MENKNSYNQAISIQFRFQNQQLKRKKNNSLIENAYILAYFEKKNYLKSRFLTNN